MKKSSWLVYLFEEPEKKNILKIMEFRSVNDISYVLVYLLRLFLIVFMD